MAQRSYSCCPLDSAVVICWLPATPAGTNANYLVDTHSVLMKSCWFFSYTWNHKIIACYWTTVTYVYGLELNLDEDGISLTLDVVMLQRNNYFILNFLLFRVISATGKLHLYQECTTWKYYIMWKRVNVGDEWWSARTLSPFRGFVDNVLVHNSSSQILHWRFHG